MADTTITPVAELEELMSNGVLESYRDDAGHLKKLVSIVDATDTVYVEGSTMDGNIVGLVVAGPPKLFAEVINLFSWIGAGHWKEYAALACEESA